MMIKINRGEIFYTDGGAGRTVVLLHGNGEEHTLFDGVCEKLRRDCRVIAVDSPGHGKSFALKKYDYYEMADGVAGLITALSLERPVLFGFSDGGILGLIIAYKYPGMLSGLIAAGANLNPRGVKATPRFLLGVSNFFKPDPLLGLMLRGPDIKGAELAGIKIPVLITAGGKDLIKEKHTKKIAESIPGAELRILRGETHSSYVKDAERLYDLIENFLEANIFLEQVTPTRNDE